MAEKKKRRGRRAHLADFYRDAAGRYVYRGAHYVCEAGEAAQAVLRRQLWPLAIAAATAVIAQVLPDTPIAVNPSPAAVLIAFGVSTGIGVIFGYLPAKKAALLNPIDALRYD